MTNEPNIESCTVALPMECNHATYETDEEIVATDHATSVETDNLSALADRVVERSERNQQHNCVATSELHSKRNMALNPKQQELKKLLTLIGVHYGASNEEIKQEFLEVMQNHTLDDCLFCYRSVAKKLQNNSSTKD